MMDFYGVRLVGVNTDTLVKVLLTVGLLVAVFLLRTALMWLADRIFRRRNERLRFWARQSIGIGAFVFIILGFLSIWFEDPTRLAAAIGLITAGIAFALQKVILAIAGYFVILRGDNFTVGDRVRMGAVRGDVISLGLFQTTIMEMGQPPPVQADDPAQWVKSRQFTGRIVSVSNAVIFDEPVYNYTRDFPYIWEELTVPVSYKDDRDRAEQVLLDAARPHALMIAELSQDQRQHLYDRYYLDLSDAEPHVYWRITDNWLELTVRFLTPEHGIRDVKDAMSRQIMRDFDAAGIGIASATYEVVGIPPIRVRAATDGKRL